MSSPHPLAELMWARVRLFFREPGAVFWTYGFPVLLTIALGVAFRDRPPDPVEVAVLDAPGGDALVRTLAGPRAHARLLGEADATRALGSGKVALVVVPGQPLTYRYDALRPEGREARLVIDELVQRAAGRTDPTATTDALSSAPGHRYVDFLVPGLIGFNLMSAGMWGVGYVLVEMRTRKLLKRFAATPMKRWHFLASFILIRPLFLVFELPVLLLFATLAFRVPIAGSLALLAAVAVLGSLAFAALGLLVASRAENTTTAGGLINLVVLPMSVGSGVFFSASRFPEVMQPVLSFLPLTALNDAIRGVMLEGAGPVAIARPLAILAAWGALSFLAAWRMFRWR